MKNKKTAKAKSTERELIVTHGFNYYAPGEGNRFASVEGEDAQGDEDDDSKRVTKRLKVGEELSLQEFIEAAVQFTFKHTTEAKGANNSEDHGAAVNSGFRGAASNSGIYGAAANSGDYGAAVNSGDYGAAFNIASWGNTSTCAKDSVAVACGYNNKAKGTLGSWIVLAERNVDGKILNMRCGLIDDERLKADTFYALEDGEFIEMADE